jgi:signal peptidase II
MRFGSRLLLIASVVGSCIGCDQVTKAVAEQSLAGREPLSLLGGIVRLSYAENPGAFLGLGADLPSGIRFWVLGVTVALVLAWVATHAMADRTAGPARLVGLAMVVGGGAGNLVDRVSAGVVRDFVVLGIDPIRTGVFNLADLAITAGVAVLLCSWRGRGAGGDRRARGERMPQEAL